MSRSWRLVAPDIVGTYLVVLGGRVLQFLGLNLAPCIPRISSSPLDYVCTDLYLYFQRGIPKGTWHNSWLCAQGSHRNGAHETICGAEDQTMVRHMQSKHLTSGLSLQTLNLYFLKLIYNFSLHMKKVECQFFLFINNAGLDIKYSILKDALSYRVWT